MEIWEFYTTIFFIGTIFTFIGIIKMRQFNELLAKGRQTDGRIVDIQGGIVRFDN